MGLDLKELSQKLDEALDKETAESLKAWLREKESEEAPPPTKTLKPAKEVARRILDWAGIDDTEMYLPHAANIIQADRKAVLSACVEKVEKEVVALRIKEHRESDPTYGYAAARLESVVAALKQLDKEMTE